MMTHSNVFMKYYHKIIGVIDAFILFEKIIQNTEFLPFKRERFIGHLCGYGYGTYDELTTALSEHKLC